MCRDPRRRDGLKEASDKLMEKSRMPLVTAPSSLCKKKSLAIHLRLIISGRMNSQNVVKTFPCVGISLHHVAGAVQT